MSRSIFIVIGLLVCQISNAQESTCMLDNNDSKILNGAYIKTNVLTSPANPQSPVREADIMWSRKIWREIDLREKFNHPLYYPTVPTADRKSLFQVLRKGVCEGMITLFDAVDDNFTTPLSRKEGLAAFSEDIDILVEDSLNPDQTINTTVTDLISGNRVKRYRIKEEWFFDKQRSVMDVRIIGIAPIVEALDEDGNVKGYKMIGWISYAQARHYLANYEVFNRWNDAQRMSYDDLFTKRMFHSYIIKESNVHDRYIASYKDGIDRLYESEDAKTRMRDFEHDLWHY